jgi:hypothetical protein
MTVDAQLLTYYQSLGREFSPLSPDASASLRRERYLAVTRGLAPANVNALRVDEFVL